jgi:hypothetical protein
MILAKARIVNYDSRILIYSFIVLATVIMVLNYDHTVITIVNYDRKTFIVQVTDPKLTSMIRAYPTIVALKH